MFIIEKRRIKRKPKVNKKLLIGLIIIITATAVAGVYFFQTQNTKNTQKDDAAISQTKENEGQQNTQTQEPTSEQPKPTQPTPTPPSDKTPQAGSGTPSISKDAPKLSMDAANKVEIGMTTNDVKSTIGAKNFDDALKAGGNLTALTLNIPGTNGGIIIGFDDEKVHSITRTYQLKENKKDSFKAINKGMAMSDVKAKLGMPATENGKKGTIVFIYKYQEGGELKEAVIAFDENDKVLVVS